LRAAENRRPGPDNIRRHLETYFQTHGVEIAAMLEMDAALGVRRAPIGSPCCRASLGSIGNGDLVVNPIVDPPSTPSSW
jgi:hypothetical protein